MFDFPSSSRSFVLQLFLLPLIFSMKPIFSLWKELLHVIDSDRFNKGNGYSGEVTEWLKVLAWNAGVVYATEGSNPSLTAIIRWTSTDTNILNDGRVPVTVDP